MIYLIGSTTFQHVPISPTFGCLVIGVAETDNPFPASYLASPEDVRDKHTNDLKKMLPDIPKWKLQYIVIFESKTKNLWIINIHIWELPPIVCIYYI